jgi:DNA-directed RNA polymerase subunit beta
LPKIWSIRRRGEIFLEAGDEIDEKTLGVILTAGFDEIPILDIDHINVGAYIRNTLSVDKNENRQDALFDIYRVMRPGEPPTIGFG